MFQPMIATGLFVMATAQDVVWARWTIEVNRGRPIAAGIVAVTIIGFSFMSIEGYIHSPWYLVPIALGSFIGTSVTTWHAKRKSHAG